MTYLVLSICFSVSVSILLKLVPHFRLDIRQAIGVNYVVAAALSALFLKANLHFASTVGWEGWVILGLLGIGLPAIFWVEAIAVEKAGVVRTDAAMRLSLLLPLVAAFLFFGQSQTCLSIGGVVVGLVAVALITTGDQERHGLLDGAGWLLTVFVGMGAIDILFKLTAKMNVGSSNGILLGTFCLAAIVSLCAVMWLLWTHRARLALRHLIAGSLLGVLNFANIKFYIDAHRALPENPALVFAAMNIGVIVVATLVGVAMFQEKLHRTHVGGLIMAVGAVLMLALGAR